jgi:hypothetical protein
MIRRFRVMIAVVFLGMGARVGLGRAGDSIEKHGVEKHREVLVGGAARRDDLGRISRIAILLADFATGRFRAQNRNETAQICNYRWIIGLKNIILWIY